MECYEQRCRQKNVKHVGWNENPSILGFSYHTANRITGISNGIDTSMTQNSGYDAMSRLTSVYSSADNEAYQYDANGNRTSQVVNGAASTVGTSATNNQLTGLSGGWNDTYGHDPNGNLTTHAYSDVNRPLIPSQIGHPFREESATPLRLIYPHVFPRIHAAKSTR